MNEPSKHEQLLSLRADVQVLEKTAVSDFESEVWASWPRLIEEFNRLNEQARVLGVDSRIDSIQRVPNGQLAHLQGVGAGMPAEKAKVSEIISKASRLRQWLDSVISERQPAEPRPDPMAVIQKLCCRFHLVVIQLRSRHEDRQTLDVTDEFDVQDLMHVLLRLFFDDIRPEERTPSHAGKSTRMDFLLKPEQIVIETKKTRRRLGAKEVGSELIIDIEHYKKHPDCRRLVCFVYDPENKIANPRGLETDLTKEEDRFSVTVFIVP